MHLKEYLAAFLGYKGKVEFLLIVVRLGGNLLRLVWSTAAVRSTSICASQCLSVEASTSPGAQRTVAKAAVSLNRYSTVWLACSAGDGQPRPTALQGRRRLCRE